MANQARALLESALRSRKLDRTLTSALAPLERYDDAARLPTGIAVLDGALNGGVPRGELSELAGPRSSGLTTMLLHMLAAATRRGELAALVDSLDRLDLASAAGAGVDLDHLLWIRGHAVSKADLVIDRALKALNLVLQSGGFGVVVFDMGDIPCEMFNRIPFTTWLRVHRAIEGSDTACVLAVPQPVARSAGGLTLLLRGSVRWAGEADRSRRVIGRDTLVRIVSPRRRDRGEVVHCRFQND
jgi:hypothetical protein